MTKEKIERIIKEFIPIRDEKCIESVAVALYLEIENEKAGLFGCEYDRNHCVTGGSCDLQNVTEGFCEHYRPITKKST